MSESDIEYFKVRERHERMAAKAATSLPARRAHQELALRYSIMIMWGESTSAVAEAA
jgi:hypothetical protein